MQQLSDISNSPPTLPALSEGKLQGCDVAVQQSNDKFSMINWPPPPLSLSKLYIKLRCDDQPMLEHMEQLLGELGGEMEGEEGEPALEEEFEPSSDEEEDDADTAMEHWAEDSHASSCPLCPL